MKNAVLTLGLLVMSTSVFAAAPAPAPTTPFTPKTLITCETAGAGGALINKIVVKSARPGYTVQAAGYGETTLLDVKVLDYVNSPVSTKIVLEANTGARTSIVMYEKQAVMLYEAETGETTDANGATVEFLKCK